MFVDAAGGDYHIRSDSPCIDAGDYEMDYEGQRDVDGQIRTFHGWADIGADEYFDANFDFNKHVGLEDFAFFAGRWLKEECDLCRGANLDGQGEVDIADLQLFAEQWMRDIILPGATVHLTRANTCSCCPRAKR